MKNQTNKNSFMSNSFWDYLKISKNEILFKKMTKMKKSKRIEILKFITEGFYPISYCSAISFIRYSEICNHVKARKIASFIGNTELGKFPLMPSSIYKDVWHCNQLKMLIESLEIESKIELKEPFDYEVIKDLEIDNSNLIKVGSICEIIEKTAPEVIQNYQDFTSSYQYIFKISSRQLKKNYLDEHSLTEGDSEDQHITLLSKMLIPLKDKIKSEEFKQYGYDFNKKVNIHLNKTKRKIEKIINLN